MTNTDFGHGAADARIAPPLNANALSGIRRLSAFDTVRARIAFAVELGLLTPGERLPDLDATAAALDVSEITVRRALVSLCQDGVLERRRGRAGGTFVADPPQRGMVGEVTAYASAAEKVHRLIDQRLLFECGIAHLAAQTVNSGQVDHLRQLVNDMAAVPSWAEFHSLDEKFHTSVAAAAPVRSAAEELGAILRELYQYFLPYPLDYLRTSNTEHRALVEALAGNNPIVAVKVTYRHISALHGTMFVGLQTSDDYPSEETQS
jgi:DNA-binding FadR family transcriptional regulator